MQLEENSKLCEPAHDQIDYTVFSPLHSQIDIGPPPYMDSPFASDFGNDDNEFHFRDGTVELEKSLSELLDEVFHNNDEISCGESTSQNNSVVGQDVHQSAQEQFLQNIPPFSSYNGSYSNMGIDTTQVRIRIKDICGYL